MKDISIISYPILSIIFQMICTYSLWEHLSTFLLTLKLFLNSQVLLSKLEFDSFHTVVWLRVPVHQVLNSCDPFFRSKLNITDETKISKENKPYRNNNPWKIQRWNAITWRINSIYDWCYFEMLSYHGLASIICW